MKRPQRSPNRIHPTSSRSRTGLLAFGTTWIQSIFLLGLASLISVGIATSLQGDEPTKKEKQQLKRIKDDLGKAGRLFKAGKYESSAEAVQTAQKRLAQLVRSADADLLKLIEPEYKRLSKAHELLTENGAKLPELAALPVAMTGNETPVSFNKQVAPIIVNRCGRCHVRGNRGNFSAASFQALNDSTMIAYGLPDDSRMIEVIVDGEMPPNGNVPDNELETLKAWIAQGAKFDGDNPQQNIGQMIQQANRNQQAQVLQATGKETVSFGLHVAPILTESCGQCHIDTNRPRGNFNMGTFRQLLAGGDSGSPVVPGKSAESPIIARLTADDGTVMPPSGKLDDRVIDVIRTWIDEGAKFDGASPREPTRFVAAKALADSQSHAELQASREALSDKNFKLIMSDRAPQKVKTNHFVLLGEVEEDRLKEVGKLAEKLAVKIKSQFKVPVDQPLVKGNSTFFVLERRYDLSELGKMLAKREIPREMAGYWNFTTVDAYGSLLLTLNKSPEEVQVEMAQQMGALHIASLSADVPRWFANGLGHWAAARTLSRNDTVKKWDNLATQYTGSMQKPDDFMNDRMPEHQAALVSFGFIKTLRSQSGFKKLLKALYDGQSFEPSFVEAFGMTPQQMVGGSNGRPNRQRRNRR